MAKPLVQLSLMVVQSRRSNPLGGSWRSAPVSILSYDFKNLRPSSVVTYIRGCAPLSSSYPILVGGSSVIGTFKPFNGILAAPCLVIVLLLLSLLLEYDQIPVCVKH